MTIELEVVRGELVGPRRDPVAGFLLSLVSPHTRYGYRSDLRDWQNFLQSAGIDDEDVSRTVVDAWARELAEVRGLAPNTVARRLSTVAGWYRWQVAEGMREHDPTAHVRRPATGPRRPSLGLSGGELAIILDAAEAWSERAHALCCLLGLSGLRISSALSIDVDGIATEREHVVAHIGRKGGKASVVPLAPRTARAVRLLAGERVGGPLFLTEGGKRLDRRSAARTIEALSKQALPGRRVAPHDFRRAFVMLALERGVPLQAVQRAVHHASPTTTMIYDQSRQDLDGHPTYVVAASLGSSAPRSS